MHLLNVQFVLLSMPEVIGHLATELDYAIRRRRITGVPTRRLVLFMSRRFKPNQTLLDHAAQHIIVPRSRLTRFVFRPYRDYPFLTLDLRKLITPQSSSPYFAFTGKHGDMQPTFALSDEEHERARKVLREMGVPQDRWLVALHARESGYHPTAGQEARNSRIQSYELAVREIHDRGGWCVRLGDATMTPAPPMPGLTDYALSRFKSEFMDVYISGASRMFLGSSSGLVFVASLFGVPVACANVVPFGTSLMAIAGSVCLPKLLVDETGHVLTFAETASHPSAFDNRCEAYEPAGLQVVDNTQEEIRELTIEVLERIEGTHHECEADRRRQEAYRRLVTPEHYCFGSSARIGSAFLKRHARLL